MLDGVDLVRSLEPDIDARARELLAAVDRMETEMKIGSTWEDRALDWAMADPTRRARILRFVDVYPSLGSARRVVEHLHALFPGRSLALPAPLRAFTASGLVSAGLIAPAVRASMERMARKFICGQTVDEALDAIAALHREGFPATIDFLGEHTFSEPEADRNLDTALSVLNAWAARSGLPSPDLSIKCSSLTSYFNPLSPELTGERLLPRLQKLLDAAAARGAHIHFDAESYDVCELGLEMHRLATAGREKTPSTGVVLQTYLRDTPARVERVIAVGRNILVRVVKGAYWDSEVVRARQNGWREPVFLRKEESDASFEHALAELLQRTGAVRVAVASHNIRSIACALALIDALKVPQDRVEFQFLYGMARATRAAVARLGHTVRVYTPYGKLIPGMAYLVRRLLENSSNQSFLKSRRIGKTPPDELLKSPHAVDTRFLSTQTSETAKIKTQITNEPAARFYDRSVRDGMSSAVERQWAAKPERVAPVVDGKRRKGGETVDSVNPSDPSRIVAHVELADAHLAGAAAESARRASKSWRETAPAARAAMLERAAGIMRERRDELAALETVEAGKPWADAQGDVQEAIDFLNYYAAQARQQLADLPLQADLPGETNRLAWRPRGVAAVISPWNFPIAIPAGQTAAALAAGNTVVFKPAEQTPLCALRLAEIYWDAGIPKGVMQFLPGPGEAGAALVDHQQVDVIAFTGSRRVGEQIQRRAVQVRAPSGAKRVIAEMGGKNAVIIDDSADLDAAIPACVHSAFNYAGQKCSALSRLILMDSVYDAFLERFVAAVRDYPSGPASLAGSLLTPLIDAAAVQRVRTYQQAAAREGKAALAPDAARLPATGYFVPPAVICGAPVDCAPAREEVFGPLVMVWRASSPAEALAIANRSDFALTGGFFSRHDGNIRRAEREFNAGNVYINRAITGAIVGRQPFGGHAASGIGSKAGGPDYLKQFCLPVTLTENLMRQGFSPDVSD